MMNKVKSFFLRFYQSYLWVFVLLLIVDQVTKLAAHFGQWNITVIPNFFYLYLTRNTGAAWSILSGNMLLLALISAAAGIGLIVFYIYKHKTLGTLKKIILAVILAGAWGNFIDRAFYKLLLGHEGVVDFLMFKFGSYIFPVFNVADICVTVGVISYAVVVTVEDYVNAKKQIDVQEESEDHEHDA